MNTQTMTTVTMQTPKFSRYRSVRKTVEPPETSPVAAPAQDPALVNRAPSRYRRPTVPSAQRPPLLPALVEVAVAKSRDHAAVSDAPKAVSHDTSPTTNKSPPAQRYRQRPADGTADVPVLPTQEEITHSPPSRYHQRELSKAKSHAPRPTTATAQSYDAAREEARMILEGEYDRLQKLKEAQKKSEKQLKAAKEAKLAEEKAVQEARAAAQARAAEAKATLEAKAAQEAQETEQRRLAQLEESKAMDTANAAARHNLNNFVDAPKAQVVRMPTQKQKRFITAPQNMVREQAPKQHARHDTNPVAAIKVQATYDAPVSAVNAGERRVEVKMNGAENGITLPVTPDTTVRDLLNSASIVMSEPVDPRTAILVESFSQFGLERPLRRYEHIRDVMNSWDMDTQNHLVIMSGSDCVATGLDKKDAPMGQPGDIEVQMFHSSKPGKWDRRWVILREDGQVTMSKRENDGEGVNICHLSDFDVYTPTRKEMKHLKPPKKICFAVKSQQKSSMFLEGTNYVHFFATGEKPVADRWYTAVQSWRSWYLANVLGAAVAPVPAPLNNSKKAVRPATANSQDNVPYQLGSFEPLLNFDLGDMKFDDAVDNNNAAKRTARGHHSHPSKHSFDFATTRRSTDQRTSVDICRMDTQRRGSRPSRLPPNSYPGKLLSEARNNIDLGVDTDEQAFTGGGLLARSGSRRTQNSNSGNDSDEHAFTGAGLLARSSSRRVQSQSHGHGASGSKKALVNLEENNEFTDGSLLRQLQAWTVTQGDQEPKIDRQRRVEADTRVGEGF